MAFKQKEPVFKVDLTKKVGPRATVKPFDREKFEEDTRVAQGMENVRQKLFSDKYTHDKVKGNLMAKELFEFVTKKKKKKNVR